MVAFVAGLDDEGADDGEVVRHLLVYAVAVLFVHGEDHAVVHLDQGLLQFLGVVTFRLDLG